VAIESQIYGTTALGISIVTAIILGIGLYINYKTLKNNESVIKDDRNIRYTHLVNDFDKDLTELKNAIRY